MTDVKRSDSMAARRHELLLDVAQAAQATARELGIADAVAEHVGAAVADMLAARWGGQQLTFPMNGYYSLAARERDILARREQGASIWELAREFKMTERGVRKLLDRVKARLVCADAQPEADAQVDLFGS